MNTARLELCKELYELSGWKDRDGGMYRMKRGKPVATDPFDTRAIGTLPAYDNLGYLLRKFIGKGGIEIRYGDQGCIASSQMWSVNANTPEEAICKLAIVLFKQGVLKRD